MNTNLTASHRFRIHVANRSPDGLDHLSCLLLDDPVAAIGVVEELEEVDAQNVVIDFVLQAQLFVRVRVVHLFAFKFYLLH